MKKLFNNSFAMLLCMAMAAVFTACEPEKEATLSFFCDGVEISDGSTFTSTKLDAGYEALGVARFVPGINLVGEKAGKVTVIVKSLNETLVEMCAFGGCQLTLPYLGYVASASGDITADAALPLEIHYTPGAINDAHHAEALITAYYDGDETNSVSFKLVMTNEGVE